MTPDRLTELRRRAQIQRTLHWADALELLDLVDALRRELRARNAAPHVTDADAAALPHSEPVIGSGPGPLSSPHRGR
jgi:hypothetical protein